MRSRAASIVLALVVSLTTGAPAAAKPGKAVGKNAATGAVVIEGLTEGLEVALIDPTARPAGAAQPSAPPLPGAGPSR